MKLRHALVPLTADPGSPLEWQLQVNSGVLNLYARVPGKAWWCVLEIDGEGKAYRLESPRAIGLYVHVNHDSGKVHLATSTSGGAS